MPTPPECPAGHFLTRWRNRTSTLRCDGPCGEPLSVRAWRWSCTLCDYDVCETCVETYLMATVANTSASRQSSAQSVASCVPCEGGVTSALVPPTPSDPSHRLKGASLHSGKPKAAATTPALATPSLGVDAGDEVPTPAETAAALYASQPISWVYAGTQGLESVKRDLSHLSATSGPNKASKHAYTSRPSRLGPPQRGADVTLADALGLADGSLYRPASVAMTCEAVDEPGLTARADQLFASVPDLRQLGLPASVYTRMESRRAWLSHLMQCELDRAARAADDTNHDVFEAACGVIPADEPAPPPAPVPPSGADATIAALHAKFAAQRSALVQEERLEIDALHAVGLCRCSGHAEQVR